MKNRKRNVHVKKEKQGQFCLICDGLLFGIEPKSFAQQMSCHWTTRIFPYRKTRPFRWLSCTLHPQRGKKRHRTRLGFEIWRSGHN